MDDKDQNKSPSKEETTLETASTRCGFVALLGQANAGKSTLMNALIGDKIAGVSNKAQTTRGRIKGIVTKEKTQLIFVDSPGIQTKPRKVALNHMMAQESFRAGHEADVICYLIDITENEASWRRDTELLARFLDVSKDSVAKKRTNILATKIDKLKQFAVDRKLEELQAIFRECLPDLDRNESEIFCLSAKHPEDLAELVAALSSQLPPGPFLFDGESLTDRPMTFIVAEHVKEQLFRQLGEELPYDITVKVAKYEERPNSLTIMADILVARESIKPMVIGQGAGKIKAIGIAARESLERFTGRKVNLKLFVKVEKDWARSSDLIAEYEGLESDE